ncbi:MAG: alkaline phosphatase family protein [Solidesulfovibrio sp. DCME]|uniref:alkaline phosphatase family protein n=1 Tax=Solidesulfovibrio sp. DCME TaxID=3447380 RepID=UPI003D14851B
MAKAKKLLVLGIDAALPDYVKRFAAEDSLPNLARLMAGGFTTRVIPTFPPLTAAAWCAIVTGAGPGTCGIPSLMVRQPGEELDSWQTSFDKRLLLAETLWESENAVGRRVALINWPVTWPMELPEEHGIQIAASLNPPFRYFYMPLWDVGPSAVFSPRKLPCDQVPGRAVQVTPAPAEPWANAPASVRPPLEFAIDVPPVLAKGPRYRVLLTASGAAGYDTATVAPSRDAAQAVAVLAPGDLSGWIEEAFTDKDGRPRRGRFRLHLAQLDPDGADFRLFSSAVNTAEAYTLPPSITPEVEAAAGPYIEVDDPWAFMDGWIGLPAYMNQLHRLADWWGEATRYALKRPDIDSVYSWVGTVDHLQHVMYGALDPTSPHYDPERLDYWTDILRQGYRQLDDALGRILGAVDLDETLVAVVSDHGFSALASSPYMKKFLKEAGLLSYEIDPATGEMRVDWARTKCFPLEPCHAHLFVNLRGRDPQGCVEPADYEKVQNEIIDALLAWRDPETGQRVVELALPRQLASQLGVYERKGFERVGDVLFAIRRRYMNCPFVYRAAVQYRDGTERIIESPELFEPAVLGRHFTGVHTALPHEPDMHCLLVLHGPGVAQAARDIPADITDIAPTLATLLGVPAPRDCEGSALREAITAEKP